MILTIKLSIDIVLCLMFALKLYRDIAYTYIFFFRVQCSRGLLVGRIGSPFLKCVFSN